jgi:ribosomal protein S27E
MVQTPKKQAFIFAHTMFQTLAVFIDLGIIRRNIMLTNFKCPSCKNSCGVISTMHIEILCKKCNVPMFEFTNGKRARPKRVITKRNNR